MPVANDPRWPSDLNGRLVGSALLRPLVELPDDITVRLGCAQRILSIEDGRRWRLEFDPDALRWSDGAPFSVKDVVRSAVEVAARPRSPAAFWLGRMPNAVRMLDSATVEYDFGRPVSFAPAVLSMPPFAPSRIAAQEDSTAPVLGPYQWGERGQEYRELQHREDIPAQPHAPRRVRFDLVVDPHQSIRRFADGDMDITPTTSLGGAELAALRGRPDLVSREIMLFGSLEFGQKAGALGTAPLLRAVLGRLLDRYDVSATTGGITTPFWSQCAPWTVDSAVPNAAPPGVNELAALRGACPEGLAVDYADFAPNGEVVAEIARQITACTGIPVRTHTHSFREYLKRAVSREHCLLYTLTAPDFAHPAAMLAPWTSAAAQARHAGFADLEFDRRVDVARACVDLNEATALWAHADRRWCEVMPKIPVLRTSAHCLWSSRVTGGGLLPDGTLPVRELRVTDA